ncbi:MAG: methyltransferase [Actinomycetota bacterium]|nr:methyltransferase [Actinomycetota bacterium]
MSDHYFSAEPTSPERRRSLSVELAGQRVEVQTAGGTFSPDRVDIGTGVLLHEAPPPPPTGTFLDLGCGWGPIALSLALLAPAALVYAVDVNERSLRLTRDNATTLGVGDRVTAATPEAVPTDVVFDLIWSNPPIRVGKDVLHEMLEGWLPRLTPGGAAHLVVQKNLGSDSLQRWIRSHEGTLAGLECERVAHARGFRVLEVRWR